MHDVSDRSRVIKRHEQTAKNRLKDLPLTTPLSLRCAWSFQNQKIISLMEPVLKIRLFLRRIFFVFLRFLVWQKQGHASTPPIIAQEGIAVCIVCGGRDFHQDEIKESGIIFESRRERCRRAALLYIMHLAQNVNGNVFRNGGAKRCVHRRDCPSCGSFSKHVFSVAYILASILCSAIIKCSF